MEKDLFQENNVEINSNDTVVLTPTPSKRRFINKKTKEGLIGYAFAAL